MADLIPLDEKLGEVLGLAQAAQAATKKVSTMEGAEDFETDLERMREQAVETERRTDELIDGLEGKKTAIREMARETKSEVAEMMSTYLSGEEEALDGFEFLTMAEAASSVTGRSSSKCPRPSTRATSSVSPRGRSACSESMSRPFAGPRWCSPSRRSERASPANALLEGGCRPRAAAAPSQLSRSWPGAWRPCSCGSAWTSASRGS